MHLVPSIAVPLLLASLAATARGAEWSWERGEDRLALFAGRDMVWRFSAGPTDTKPHFHPLGPVGGPVLTAHAPPDHPWHYGLWFSWKYINGVNFWEEDRRTGRAQGITRWDAPSFETRLDGSAGITQVLSYVLPDGSTALEECRKIGITAPGADGSYALDWDATFTARREVTLDRTPLPTEPRGQAWGGYAGLSLRLSTGLVARAVASDQPLPEWRADRLRFPARALDYAGEVGGRSAGVAILDHPGNPDSPVTWYVIRSPEMSFLSPALLAPKPRRLGEGESLRLRYRVWVHPGAWTPADLAARQEPPFPHPNPQPSPTLPLENTP